jgi:oligosaccharide repeat unit polymerase
MTHIELFGGALRASPYLLALDILLLIHFAFSYYTTCYRKGFKIDYWHFNIFLGFVVPFLLIYPFAGSYLNAFATGGAQYAISRLVDVAFVITIIGYVSTYSGFYYHDLSKDKSFLYLIVNRATEFCSRQLYCAVYHSTSLYPLALVGLLLSITFLAIAFSRFGMTFDLREEALGDPLMQPFFNLVLQSYIPTVSTFVFVRYLQFKEKSMLILLMIFTMAAILSGSRTALILPFYTGILIYLIAQRRQFSILKYAGLSLLTLAVLFYLGDLRAGSTSISSSLMNFGYNIAYGNNFSDIRDFAWILSYWKHEYLLGKSYLAALLSFVPRSLSDFREVWSISVYTNSLVGFDPAEHAGLRPGKFGEPYLNFGLYGVVTIGFLGGYILRFIDVKIKAAVRSKTSNFIKMYSYTFLSILVFQLYITASFWTFYVFILIVAAGYFARQLLKPVSRKRRHASTS